MQVVHKAINFDLEQVVAEEVPFLSTFYRDGAELNQDIKDLLAFPAANKDAMPFYTMKDSTTYRLNKQFEDYYQMMDYALAIAFHEPKLLRKFFDCEFLREHGDRFIPYTEATFHKKHPALYGRFDACFDPESEELKGVYEFNGDTPVMLFESVNLQQRFAEELGTDQYNNYWHIFIEEMRKQGYKNVAVACGTDYVEDMATCETLSQAFAEALPGASVKFLDLKELDFCENSRTPFYAQGDDKPLDAVYILSPWEEMVSNFPQMLDNWEYWVDNVHLFEPAWRWFFAHKGMTALCTELMAVSKSFNEKFKDVKLIHAMLESEFTPAIGKWVEKPVVGRLSNNIKIWNNGELESDTGGYYTGENTIFQAYCPPGQVNGKNFILGFWMCGKHSASVCFREFDSEVLSISNERFVPHIVVE
ncbi:MAG: glutathionylspermidine synthase domain-containing [Caudoviricetes sp.]|nr:MAG: glutathionylspermidine synthase domain-containing [Caudoviricetes sp.]